ncbi:MAG: hypothetical protein R3C12_14355 [Planctomycetaceae bacterium]|nr:hypothetical protein [Planctomycetaceae bacterium]
MVKVARATRKVPILRPWFPLLTLLAVLFPCLPASAQETAPAEGTQAERSLSEIQQSISARYQRFAKTLTQLHGYMKETDPARAELLMRVIGRSNEARVDAQMDIILQLLSQENPQYGSVVERQEDLIQSLLNLLDVLQSEDERKRIADEIARIEELIGDLNKLVVEQKEVRAGTERGRSLESLEQRQQGVTDKTEKLADKIDQQDRERREQAEAEQRGEKQGEGEQQDGSKQDQPPKKPGESPEQQPSESEAPPSEKTSPKEPSESQPGEQKSPQDSSDSPSDSQSQQQQQQQQQQKGEQQKGEQQPSESDSASQPNEPTPGREEIESAIDKMQRAIDELKEKNRDQASREQDQAIAELEKAKAKLEEILRQLREEEQKILLADLEARFRKMLLMQVNVRKSSGQIQEIPDDQRLPRHRARATQLARDEREIVLEVDKALILLREEGTSVAFPEAVVQIREDMQTVAEWLNSFEVNELTLAIEDDIIEALEELVEALRKEMEKLEEQEQQQQQQQQQQDDPELIDLIAELKLLRSLQYRVNRRTQQLGRTVEGEQAAENSVLELLSQLAERQARIQRATYDLSTGKNR